MGDVHMVSLVKRKAPLPPRTTRLRRRGRPKYRSYVPDRGYQDWIRSRGCACGLAFGHQHGWTGARILTANPCDGPIEFAHVTSRGAGGKDQENGIGLCRWHHAEQHRMGVRSFAAHHGINLRATAERLWAEFVTERGSE